MNYGTLKVDALIYTSGGSDQTITVSSVVLGNYPNLSITGTISGAVITGDTGRFNTFTGQTVTVPGTLSGTTITGDTAKVTTLTGISGTFTDTISGAVVTGNTGRFNQFTGHVITAEATLSGATITGNTGKFTTLTGVSGVLNSGLAVVSGSAGFGLLTPTSGATVDVSGSYVGNVASISALNIDCSSGNYFVKTITGDSTFTISNAPASGRSYGFTLEITHTSGTITWFSGVYWPAATAPTLTTGNTHLFIFITDDGGTKWRGASLVDYSG